MSLCIILFLFIFFTFDTFYSEDNMEIEDEEGRMGLECDSPTNVNCPHEMFQSMTSNSAISLMMLTS